MSKYCIKDERGYYVDKRSIGYDNIEKKWVYTYSLSCIGGIKLFSNIDICNEHLEILHNQNKIAKFNHKFHSENFVYKKAIHKEKIYKFPDSTFRYEYSKLEKECQI